MSWRTLRRNLERYGAGVCMSELLGSACRPSAGGGWKEIVGVHEASDVLVLAHPGNHEDQQSVALSGLDPDAAVFMIHQQFDARLFETRLALETAQAQKRLIHYGPAVLPKPRLCGADQAKATQCTEKRLLVF